MTLESDHIDSQIRANRAQDGGDNIQRINDPRVTTAISWVWTSLGAGVIGAVLYVGSQLGGLRDAVADTNLQVALSRQQATNILETLKDHETRIRENEGDIRQIQGRNLRGPPELPRVR